MHDAPIQFRFTLAGLCLATAFAAGCFAVLLWTDDGMMFPRIFAAFILACAAVGSLFGNALAGGLFGISAFLVLYAVSLLVLLFLSLVSH
jgi:hypothetical protein